MDGVVFSNAFVRNKTEFERQRARTQEARKLQGTAMASVSFGLQQGLYEALIGDTPLGCLLGGPHIYDGAPHDAEFPYVTIDQIATRDWSTGDGAGFEHLVTLSVWSRYSGKREAHALLDAIYDCLHEADLDIKGASLINLRFESSSVSRDEDGATYHGLIRFRAVTEPDGE